VENIEGEKIVKILFRYILHETLKYLLMVLCLVVLLFVVIDYISHVDKFISSGIRWTLGLTYVLLRIPYAISVLGPVVVLLAALIVFGVMGKNREILALNTSGVSPFALFKPVLFVGVAGALLLFINTNWVSPPTIQEAHRIKQQEIRKDEGLFVHKENVWIKDTKMIGHIRYYDPKLKKIFGITLNFFDDNFRLKKRIEAKEGVVHQGYWEMQKVLVLSQVDENRYVTTNYKSIKQPMKWLPEKLTDVVKQSEEMSTMEMYQYIQRIEREGHDATYYRVEFQSKLAFPLACIIMCLVAVGVSARITTRLSSFAIGVGAGICVAFAYWALYSFCLSLGYAGQLPPIIAGWTANALFLCIGSAFLQGIE